MNDAADRKRLLDALADPTIPGCDRADPQPPPSRTKARYLHWRRLYDANYSISFGDYLRRRLYDDPSYGAP